MIFVTTRVMAGRQLGYGGRGHSFKKHQRKWWLQISWFAGEWPACPRVFPRTPGKLLKPGPSLPKQKSSACQRGRLGKPNEAGFVGNPPRRWFCVIREWDLKCSAKDDVCRMLNPCDATTVGNRSA
jgi:hypothetical protein